MANHCTRMLLHALTVLPVTKALDKVAATETHLLARFGGLPQWAVSGETFPVGCQFAASLPYARFFSANPDKRRRCYSSPCGMLSAQRRTAWSK